jgi:ATP synthase protein I
MTSRSPENPPPDGQDALRTAARNLALRQAAVTAALSLLLLAGSGLPAALSAALGGGTAVLGTWVFGWRATRGASEPRALAQAFYRAEAWKLGATLAAFGIAWTLWEIQGLWLVIGYAVAAAMYWLALLRA